MNIVIFLVCFLFIGISLLMDKRVYNPIVLFSFWWGITIFISGVGFYDINIPEIDTYLIMLVGIISFNFACLFILLARGAKKTLNITHEINDLKNLKMIKISIIGTQMLIIIELIRRSIKVMYLIAAGMDYEQIRFEYFYNEEIVSGFNIFISGYLVNPFITFSTILTGLIPFDKALMGTTSICVALSAFSSGGREIVLKTGLVILLAYLIEDNRVKSYRTHKSLHILVIGLLVIFFLVYISIARGTTADIDGVLQTVVLYFTAPYIFFELLSPYALQDNILVFGGAFFGGIVDTVIMAIRVIFRLDISTMTSIVASFNQMFLQVGGNLMYNAFPTMLYTFLYDFGYLGIIIGPFWFGLMSMVSYMKMITCNRIAFKGIYIMIALMIYDSVMKWAGTSASVWVVMLLFLVFDRVARNKNS